MLAASVLSAAYALPAATAEEDPALRYRLDYTVRPIREASGAEVELELTQGRYLLREVDLRAPRDRISEISGDGDISEVDGRIVWAPPAGGGTLRWFATINHARDDETFDAYVDRDWAVFRADDILPAATTRTLKGAHSETWLHFDLPVDWSSATQYFGRDHSYSVENPKRRFDRPTGWIALGRLGVRNETIAGVQTKVAAPVGHGVRRLDMLALLQWTLPETLRLFPEFPGRLTIVSAAEPMWRGGLSAPQSIFIHASRPLISENGTSTLLHETVHVGLGVSAAAGADWIVEGLAEFYGLRILERSGTITRQRYEDAMEALADWGRGAANLCRSSSGGSTTARAVIVLQQVDRQIESLTGGRRNLDDVLPVLGDISGGITVAGFRDAVAAVAGATPQALDSKNLPGCN